jgi:hypothetical protein
MRLLHRRCCLDASPEKRAICNDTAVSTLGRIKLRRTTIAADARAETEHSAWLWRFVFRTALHALERAAVNDKYAALNTVWGVTILAVQNVSFWHLADVPAASSDV